MPLIRDDDLARIDLPTPGEWVEVKRQLSKGDRIRIQAAAMSLRMRLQGGEMQGEQTIDEAMLDGVTFRALEVGIKRWSFGVPVTAEAIRELDEASYDRVTEETNRLWRPIPETEKNA